jgi:probable DNA metabolism protein
VTVTNFAEWRLAARELLSRNVKPGKVDFYDGLQQSFADEEMPGGSALPSAVTVPRAFLELAEFVAMHRDPARWNLLYRVAWRIVSGGERHLLRLEIDPDIRQLSIMRKALARDIHKMHAFVRFRKTDAQEFVAFHRPDHFIAEHVAPWFVQRFGAMHWTILTPDRSVCWDTKQLCFGPGVPVSEAPGADVLEELWLSYYAGIFNPARVNVSAMKKELPVRHWATLPEAALIPTLLLGAASREEKMRDLQPASAEPYVPQDHGLPVLAAAIHECRGCDLYLHATQPVFGEGPAKARIMMVGEQPGDSEDQSGKPFVGPAGKLLDRALKEAGIDRSAVYVTNAVKHFKFEERGKRRIHKKPRGTEIAACQAWLNAELGEVDPQVVVALGATAALSLGGRDFAIQKERGRLMPMAGGRQLLITVHPSFLLRLPEAEREAEFGRFVRDLKLVS